MERISRHRPARDKYLRFSIGVSAENHRHPGDDREEVAALAHRRFGPSPAVGTGPELGEHFAALADRGFERIYAWFCDFAQPETLATFGAEVIAQFGGTAAPPSMEAS